MKPSHKILIGLFAVVVPFGIPIVLAILATRRSKRMQP